MGADIYLESEHKECQRKAQRNFNKWVKKRDSLPYGSKEAEAAQKKVEEWYDKMYERGYFRDSYNGSSLFWLLGLSWWELSNELCDDNGYLPIDNARILLARLENLPITDKMFGEWERERREEGWDFKDPNTPEAWRKRFIEKRQEFINMLRHSIQIGESLYWSV